MAALVGVLLALFSLTAFAQADYAREQRWADEITPAILVGDPVQLALPGGRKFLGIYAPNSKAQAGVVVVHGLGVHPDWGLINPLRSQLSEQGYATLSVQMPVLASDAPGSDYPPTFPEAAERIAVAVNYLRGKGHKKIAVVSHSLGARMTNVFLNQADAPPIAAWVAIGLPGEFTKVEMFKAPVLDLYGEKDPPAVLEAAAKRADAIRNIRGSAQIRVAGADHFFNGMDKQLVHNVKLFLDRSTR
jgi:dienelactone hydrolase